jgi:hypothetical protein
LDVVRDDGGGVSSDDDDEGDVDWSRGLTGGLWGVEVDVGVLGDLGLDGSAATTDLGVTTGLARGDAGFASG